MNKFNYFPYSPYTNPNGELEKQTNELPTELKTETTTKKRRGRPKKNADMTETAETTKK